LRLGQELFDVSQVPLEVSGELDGHAVGHGMPTVLKRLRVVF
jgi:hypothetical protein